MSRGVNPSLVSWLTTMMGLRLQVVLEHMPVGPDAILRYVRRVGDPPQVRGLMGCEETREMGWADPPTTFISLSISQSVPEEPMEVQGAERTSPEPQVLVERPGTVEEMVEGRGLGPESQVCTFLASTF